MGALKFSVEKMFRLPDAGALKAFADVSVNDAIVIRGIRVMDGKKGLFVGLPREQGKDNKWYDLVSCRSSDVYGELSTMVLDHYKDSARV